MNQILQKIGMEMKKRKEITAAAIGLLVVVLLSVSVFGTLSTQEAAAMENPVQGISEDSSLIQLSGTKEVLAQAPKGASLEADEQNSSNEAEEAQEDSGQESRASAASGAGRDSSAQAGSGRNSGTQGNNADNKGDNKSEQPKENKDLDDEGNKEEYFKTNIVNDGTITVRKLEYSITHLTDLKVKQIQNKVNDSHFSDYNGEVQLAVGKNTVTVRVTYLGTDGKTFHAEKKYTVYVDIENIVIRCELDERPVSEINKDNFRFFAYAMQAGKRVDLQVNLESSAGGVESHVFSGEWVTLENLKEGEYTIRLTAEKDGKSADPKGPYTLIYKKPSSEKLRVVSAELEAADGTTVYYKTFGFNAEGYRGSKKVSVRVKPDWGEELTPEENTDWYTIRLEKGVNTISVTPYEGDDEGETQEYTVTFMQDPNLDPDGGGSKEKAPTLDCPDLDALNGQTVTNSPLIFMVYATDYEGYAIPTGNIWGSCNSIPLSQEWGEPGKISFNAVLTEGAGNIISITVEDEEGHQTSKTYSVNYAPPDPDRPIGTISLSVEAGTIGMGNLFGGDVEIRQNDTFDDVLTRAMEGAGFWCDWAGEGSDTYLVGVGANYHFVYPSIPSDLAEIMQGISDSAPAPIFYPESYDSDYLGEFDFSTGSGWMYSINKRYPNYSMGAYTPQNGDVVRVRYTLYYGSDIGGAGAVSNGGNNSGAAEGFGKEW